MRKAGTGNQATGTGGNDMRLVDADEILRYMEDKEISQCLYEVNEGNDKYSSTPLYDYVKAMPTAYDVDKVVEKLEEKIADMNFCEYRDAFIDAIEIVLMHLCETEIVKQGGVSDDVCEWKLEDEEANLYLTGCQQRQLIFEGTPKENGYRYCPYCGKKIKVVE